MLKVALLLALGGMLCVAEGAKLSGTHTADKNFLDKQKKLYNILLYIRQNDLKDTDWYNTGMHYDISENMDNYKNQTVVKQFLWMYKRGMFLSRGAISNQYNHEQRYEMQLLFDLFYTAKDFETFYKTACFARIFMNDGMFTMAFTTAVNYRSDCQCVRLPMISEIYPNLFFESRVIQQAHYLKMIRGTEVQERTYIIPANYSSKYMYPYVDYEYKLDYYIEDADLNAYYYYFRMASPIWLNNNKRKEICGECYFFIHKQLMARYNLERRSNDISRIASFDWNKPVYPLYFSNLMYSNGVAVPKRHKYASLPFHKYNYLTEVFTLENRIMDAIDSGYLIDTEGRKIDIYTPGGLNMLANVIEGNGASCNRRYYGMYDAVVRNILGFSFDKPNQNVSIPSALEMHATNMRDPAFYMLYSRIMSFFFRYKKNQPQYTEEELVLPGVEFEFVSNVDKLYTYFDKCDTVINNAVAVDTFTNGKKFVMKARRPCLNYQPFMYNFTINSKTKMDATLSIFLGPAYDDVKDDMVYLKKFYYQFMQMDQFNVTLVPGPNNIQRSSSESSLTTSNMMEADYFYSKLNKAISGSEPFVYSEEDRSFPEHLTLPRGRTGGMKYKMFFFLSTVNGNDPTMCLNPAADKFPQKKSLGFPLDRPMPDTWNYSIPNMFFKDVYIYEIPKGEGMNY
ncbi:hexamerin 70c [Osmia lignaria lignaria]|uniref:hexamerin 70c n=1 Tax=Osmia lignaria lignaria TaxID=1437193 RepID=UPI00402B4660